MPLVTNVPFERLEAFSLTRFWFSRCVDDTKNRLSFSRGALAPGSYRDQHEPGANAPRLMNNQAQQAYGKNISSIHNALSGESTFGRCVVRIAS